MPDSKLLIYLLRRDLRLADNPIFAALADPQSKEKFTHVLPLYVFPAQQVEVSGFIPKDSGAKSPYPEARSALGGFWRCGQHRVKFLGESVWDLKQSLEEVGSGMAIRVGMVSEVVKSLVDGFEKEKENVKVSAVWMTAEEGNEEKSEEREVERVCDAAGIDFKLWTDEKYLIDDRDVPFSDPRDLPDVFTNYRKKVEPLRSAPRPSVPRPTSGSLPSFPSAVPPQHSPFQIPTTYEGLEAALFSPIQKPDIKNPPSPPSDTKSAHPFNGGSTTAIERVKHLLEGSHMTAYKDTRNGLLGTSFSTKLSAWLALGCISSRQVHEALLVFEDGLTSDSDLSKYRGSSRSGPSLGKDALGLWAGVGAHAKGYGEGENNGTKAVRFELLWRDYMRLCTRKFGLRLFAASGFRADSSIYWKSASIPVIQAQRSTSQKVLKTPGKANAEAVKRELASKKPKEEAEEVREMLERFLNGTTGMGLIDASQRELYHTGYTSNRARQNVASFLAKHLGVDWRYGAEWYESMLVDYDVSSNWGNWQYVAGVGNDPRAAEGGGGGRVFNPVKQAYDYDASGDYVRAWVEELRSVVVPTGEGKDAERDRSLAVGQVFQAWTVPEENRESLGLKGLLWVEEPLRRIEFTVGRRGNARGRGRGRGGGGGYGGHRGGRENGEKRGLGGSAVGGYGYAANGWSGGWENGHGNARNGYSGHAYAYAEGSEYGGGGGGNRFGQGRNGRMGMMERDAAARHV